MSVQPGFSNHQHSDRALGRVDVVYVSGATADAGDDAKRYQEQEVAQRIAAARAAEGGRR